MTAEKTTKPRKPAAPQADEQPLIVIPLGTLEAIHSYLCSRPFGEIRQSGLIAAIEGLPTLEQYLKSKS